MDAVTILSVADYDDLLDDFDALQTFYLDGTWPVSRGHHADLGEILLAHIGGVAVLIRPLWLESGPVSL